MKTKKQKTEKSFNALDIISESFSSLKRKQTKAILGSVFVLTVVALVFGVFYGLTNSLVLAGVTGALMYGILIIPFINFICNVAEGRGALEDMFQKDQYSLSNILIGFVFSALVLFGAALFIIPAFIVLTLFVLALPIASNTTSKCFDAFIKSKELSKGFRGRVLSVMLIWTAVLLICIGLSLGISALIFLLIFKLPIWWLIGISVGLMAFLAIFMPYFTLSIVYLYDNTIAEKQENANKSNNGSSNNSNEENVKEEVIDFKPQTDNKDTGSSNPFDYSDIIRY